MSKNQHQPWQTHIDQLLKVTKAIGCIWKFTFHSDCSSCCLHVTARRSQVWFTGCVELFGESFTCSARPVGCMFHCLTFNTFLVTSVISVKATTGVALTSSGNVSSKSYKFNSLWYQLAPRFALKYVSLTSRFGKGAVSPHRTHL